MFFLPLILADLYEEDSYALCSLLAVLFLFFKKNRGLYLSLLFLYSFIFLFSKDSESLSLRVSNEYVFRARVLSPIVNAKSVKKLKLKVESFSLLGESDFIKSEGLYYLYLKEEDRTVHTFSYGDELSFRAFLFRPRDLDSREIFDFASYLKKTSTDGLLSLRELYEVKEASGLWSKSYKAVLKLREDFIERVSRSLRAEQKPVLEAILFSKKDSMDYDNKRSFLEAGLLHLFAVSGFHVGIMALFVTILLRCLRLPYRMSLALMPVILFLYVMMSGFAPSALRAWLMITVWSFSRTCLRPQTAENSLCIAAWILLMSDYMYLLDAGFLYSFIIVFTLVRMGKVSLELLHSQEELNLWTIRAKGGFEFFPFIRALIFSSLLCSLAAFVGSLALNMYYNALWTWSAIYLNIFAALTLPLIFLVSFLSLFVTEFSVLNVYLVDGLIHLSDYALSDLRLRPSLLAVLCYYLALFLALIVFQYRKRALFVSLSCLLFISFVWTKPENHRQIIFLSNQRSADWAVIIQASEEDCYIKENKDWHNQQFIEAFQGQFSGHALSFIKGEKRKEGPFVFDFRVSARELMSLEIVEERYLYRLTLKSNMREMRRYISYKDRVFRPFILKF